jgi:hypothetical protein
VTVFSKRLSSLEAFSSSTDLRGSVPFITHGKLPCHFLFRFPCFFWSTQFWL